MRASWRRWAWGWIMALALSLPSGASATSLVAIDARSGEVLVNSFGDLVVPPASLAKLMTFYLVYEDLHSRPDAGEEIVTISHRAGRQPPSRAGLYEGQQYLYDAMAVAMSFSWPNDVTMALAEHVAGSAEVFVDRMNARALDMCLSQTLFRDPTGAFPIDAEGAQTTPLELAQLARYLDATYPEAMRVIADEAARTLGRVRRTPLRAVRNAIPDIDGGLASFTNRSGYTAVVTVTRGERRVIAVVYGASNSEHRRTLMRDLLDEAFAVENHSRPRAVALGGCSFS